MRRLKQEDDESKANLRYTGSSADPCSPSPPSPPSYIGYDEKACSQPNFRALCYAFGLRQRHFCINPVISGVILHYMQLYCAVKSICAKPKYLSISQESELLAKLSGSTIYMLMPFQTLLKSVSPKQDEVTKTILK